MGLHPHRSLAELRAKKETSSPTAPSEVVREIDPIVERVIVRCIRLSEAVLFTSWVGCISGRGRRQAVEAVALQDFGETHR